VCNDVIGPLIPRLDAERKPTLTLVEIYLGGLVRTSPGNGHVSLRAKGP
jgi:hypothetical protein